MPPSNSWDHTPLGPAADWPASLRSTLALVLRHPFPALVVWGPSHIVLHNDAFGALLGPRHPGSFGRPLPEVLPDLDGAVGCALSGETLRTTVRLGSLRHRVALTPIEDDDGRIGGVHCVVSETHAAMARLQAVAALPAAEDISEVLDEIVDTAVAITGADTAEIRLYEPRSGDLTIVAHHGMSPSLLAQFAVIGSDRASELRSALANSKSMGFADIGIDPRMSGSPERERLLAAGIHGLVLAPMRTRSDAIIGVLCVHYGAPIHADEAHPALELLARLAADLVERQGLLVERREAERRYRQFTETLTDPVLVVDPRGHIAFANRIAETTFGYGPGELDGKPHEVLIPEPLRAIHAANIARYLARPVALPVSTLGEGELALSGLRRDGTTFPVELSLDPVATPEGTMVSAVVRDVSEIEHPSQSERLQAARFSGAIEAIPDAIAVWDADDKLVACNSALGRLLTSVTPESPLGMRAAELGARAQRLVTDGDGSDRTWLEGEWPDAGEVQLADGRQLRVTSRRIRGGGRITVAADLTEDLSLQRALVTARAEAEAASRAKSEFLASMSHELRTPLNAVLGFCQLLQRDRREPLTERQREMVDQVYRGGEHLLHIVDDVLDLARIEADRLPIAIEPVDVPSALRDVVETLGPVASAAGVRVSIDPLPDLPPIEADPRRLAQILMNLGSNAVKYNRADGAVRFAAAAREETIRLSVSDTGRGIPPEHHGHLFQPFHRAGQETGSIEGTGIGLTISQRLAGLMGGTIGFRSVLGEGSTFWVDLPIHTREAAPRRAGLSRPPDAALAVERALVLYVEDNPTSVAFVRSALDAIGGIELATAPTAEQGLALARARRPDLVLMDINLPGMSGFEALHALRETPETKDVPVIALSAAASASDRERGLRAGFARYLAKPVRVEELEAAIEALLGER